ncbi:MAG: DUF962 domain-containing protein [Myxococcales bacterium]|nr:DUF962 domain-containing protein [Myxococcales bacterium]
MSEKRIETFEEFWPYYVGEHRKPLTRGLHYLGTSAALISAVLGAFTLNGWLVLIAPVLGYGPAWIGHFFVERNKPATFTYPGWSFLSDMKMVRLALRGKMAAEVTRLYGSPAPAPDAPCLAKA